MNILVVGGAGYIGSHMVKMLLEQGHAVIAYDNLSTGFRDAVLGGEFVEGDLADTGRLDETFRRFSPDAVMHFASHIQVGESVTHPAKYYANNVVNTLNLLDAMVRHGVSYFIFSSTAAIFGEPEYLPINTFHPKAPFNPYGRSKWMVEMMLEDYERAYGLKSVCLRYFNAAGADPSGALGERHEPETHLIPLVLQALSGKRDSVSVFGRDYDTPDGTCIRDYIHVNDLCAAHSLALERLMETGESSLYNLGNGQGFSVQEVIDAAQRVTGRRVKVVDRPRRPGDPARLVADPRLAQKELGWKPAYPDLETMILHAWTWESLHLPIERRQRVA